MRTCIISSEGKTYDENTEFASYSVQKTDGSRILILQFIRGRGDEQFVLISLTKNTSTVFATSTGAAATPATTEEEFKSTYNIASESKVSQLLREEGVAYALNIVPKQYLEPILHNFETISTIRAAGASKALATLCEPVKKLTGIEINPVELALQVSERIGDIKSQNRCNMM
ncbi:MAG: hypothetical protein K0S29_851 [Gammaproteobacteria bacterium]|jgi:hypothetical protein|nr:hypothetical protein [Gammaproteobacteria bacterium]